MYNAPAARTTRVRLFVAVPHLWKITYFSCLVGLLVTPWAFRFSGWLPLGVALSVFVAWHAIEASRELPWIPGLTMTVACVQWVLAPWAVYAIVGDNPLTPMMVPATDYFAYAVPATCGLVVGLFLPMWREGRRVGRPRVIESPISFQRTCTVMVVGGIFIRLFIKPLLPGGLGFAAYLVASLYIVGTCGLLLSNAPRWKWSAIAIVVLEAFLNTLDAQYLDMMLVVGFLAVMYVYRFRVRGRTIVALVGAALLGLLAVNALKMAYRVVIRSEDIARDERLGAAGAIAGDIVSDPGNVFAASNLLYNLYRLNEGAIISRVLVWVPNSEPFAGGETITTAVRAALVPRVIAPDKARAGGFDNYTRFTGFALIGATSINIATAGEMYANFGRWGGVLGMLGYGVVIGWVYSLLARLSRRSPLWWAWAPYIFYSTVSAEMGTNEVLNQLTKALVILLIVVFVVPAWAAIRRKRPPNARAWAVATANGAPSAFSGVQRY